MNRYKIERRGGPDKWGPYQIIDANLGSFKPIAIVDDGERAQKIVDLLNTDYEEYLAEEIRRCPDPPYE